MLIDKVRIAMKHKNGMYIVSLIYFSRKQTMRISGFLINHNLSDTVLIHLDVIWSQKWISIIALSNLYNLQSNPMVSIFFYLTIEKTKKKRV